MSKGRYFGDATTGRRLRLTVRLNDGWAAAVARENDGVIRMRFVSPSSGIVGSARWNEDERAIRYVKGYQGLSVPDSIVARVENELRKAL